MNAEEILTEMTRMRRAKEGYLTNLCVTQNQLQAMLEEPGVQVITGEELLMILQPEDDMIRLSYATRSEKRLSQLAELLPHCKAEIVVDVVGKEPQAKEQMELLCRYGFEPYKIFVRMTVADPVIPRQDGIERVSLAHAEDAEKIRLMICNEFDPLFAHIPKVEELRKNITEGDITVIRDGGNIVGMAFFEHNFQRYITLRYFIVDEKYRGQNIGGALLAHEFLQKPEKAIYMLWVGTYNKTQRLYEKLGFTQDGLRDYILLWAGEKGQNATKG